MRDNGDRTETRHNNAVRLIVRCVKGVLAFPSTGGVFSPRKNGWKIELEERDSLHRPFTYGSRLGLKQELLLL
jgi:hypothetical protein